MLVIGPKLNPAPPTLRVLLPFHDSVMLAALRTRIARRQLPIFLGFQEARLRVGPPSIRAIVEPEVELVKYLPLTPIHLFATHLHFGNVCLVYRYAKESVRKAPLFCQIVPLSKRFPVRRPRRQVFEIIRHLVSPVMPFANLPDTHKSRWGDELTAEKMKECIVVET